MTYSEANQTLFSIIEIAILKQAQLHQDNSIGTESNPAKFGNVEFFKDSLGNWCYSLPHNMWDSLAVTKDLQYWF